MYKLRDLKDKLCDELRAYADEELTRESLEIIDKLAHAGKNVAKLIKCCESEGSYGMGRGSYDGPWSGGANGREGSYARGRMRAARDSMGRYSRDGNDAHAEFAEELRKMGANLPENFRGEIMRMADKMEHMEGNIN